MDEWKACSEVLDVDAGQVHVWRFNSYLDDNDLSSAASLLSPDERSRAERYAFEPRRRRFIAGRAWLRTLLAAYLGIDSRKVEFQYGEFGKPELAGTYARQVCFNISYTEVLALVAVTLGHRLGVDIEKIGPIHDMDYVAEMCFSKNELTKYRSLAEGQRQVAFFNCWTRKEAFIKAIGAGFSYPLHSFDVTLVPDEQPAIVSIEDEAERGRWSITSLEANAGYAAALAVDCLDFSLRLFESGTLANWLGHTAG